MSCIGRAALAALALSALSVSSQAQQAAKVAAPSKVDFHIAREPLGQALNEVGQRSGLTIIIAPSVPQSLLAPPVSGRFTPEEVLHQLLAPVGLRAEFLDAGTVAVRFAAAGNAGT
ncbi:MAG TPA: STN domain-containing protein, partial [Steroidobacteraceae bacterium]|nr:STN domain-containing protein [Steroidobacteraceae bacterium]